MKDYMLRMGRKLNGIKDQSKVSVKPVKTQFKYNFKPKNGKSTEGVMPMFFQALELINSKQKKKPWHNYKRGRKRHGIYRK
jgi:hypothetical protein